LHAALTQHRHTWARRLPRILVLWNHQLTGFSVKRFPKHRFFFGYRDSFVDSSATGALFGGSIPLIIYLYIYM
jgi:hypothetical protein